jgi:hypothetical protein
MLVSCRRRVPDEAEVPVRVVQHEAQARRERLRRRRHGLLRTFHSITAPALSALPPTD